MNFLSTFSFKLTKTEHKVYFEKSLEDLNHLQLQDWIGLGLQETQCACVSLTWTHKMHLDQQTASFWSSNTSGPLRTPVGLKCHVKYSCACTYSQKSRCNIKKCTNEGLPSDRVETVQKDYEGRRRGCARFHLN